jgi:hypothetical protein
MTAVAAVMGHGPDEKLFVLPLLFLPRSLMLAMPETTILLPAAEVNLFNG